MTNLPVSKPSDRIVMSYFGSQRKFWDEYTLYWEPVILDILGSDTFYHLKIYYPKNCSRNYVASFVWGKQHCIRNTFYIFSIIISPILTILRIWTTIKIYYLENNSLGDSTYFENLEHVRWFWVGQTPFYSQDSAH